MGVLLMLMTIGVLIVGAISFVGALYAGKVWLRNFICGGIAIWSVFHFLMLFGFSFVSTEQDLTFNEPKHFCGFYLDCHIHTAVVDLRKTRTIGNKTAAGEFYIVTVKVFSDAKAASLGLLTVDAHVVDLAGQKYTRDMDAETALGSQSDFDKKVSPVESFEKEIVFDLPTNLATPRLDIREGYGTDHAIEAVLIDDEDSIFHGRNYFVLSERDETAGVR